MIIMVVFALRLLQELLLQPLHLCCIALSMR